MTDTPIHRNTKTHTQREKRGVGEAERINNNLKIPSNQNNLFRKHNSQHKTHSFVVTWEVLFGFVFFCFVFYHTRFFVIICSEFCFCLLAYFLRERERIKLTDRE